MNTFPALELVPGVTHAAHTARKRVATAKHTFGRKLVLLSALCPVTMSVALADSLPDFERLVSEQGQSVVNIEVQKTTETASSGAESPNLQNMPEGLRRFFEQNPQQGAPENDPNFGFGVGSGFIISDDGYVVTNAHVVDGASTVTITMHDRREFDATLVGSDEVTDIALLKIDATGLPEVTLGDSDNVRVGQWVLAIGSPFGLEQTATQGIVSATTRSLPSGGYTPFIQTDVAVNPGNSGGPLYNTAGEVIGVNSQIYSRTGGYQGLSFAIPSNVVTHVVEQLKTDGFATRGWLGVAIQDVDQGIANAFGLDRLYGALVSQVSPDGPALAAGIEQGDIIIRVDDQPVERSSDLPALIGTMTADTDTSITLLRDGKELVKKVTIGKFGKAGMQVSSIRGDVQDDMLGLVASAASQEELKTVGLDHGVLVKSVSDNGAARKAGLQANDIIVAIKGVDILEPADIAKVIAQHLGNKSLPVLIQRGEQTLFVAIETDLVHE